MSTAENVKQQVLDYIRGNIRDRFPDVTDSMLPRKSKENSHAFKL